MKTRTTVTQLLVALSVCSFTVAADDFESCVTQLKQQAKQAGLSAQTIDATLGQVKHVSRVIVLDKKQPEFSQSFANYFIKRVTDRRVEEGRRLLAKHHKLLQQLEKTYGVPPQYLIAFWGLETNFGSYKGKLPVIDSLTTLACDQRRSQYFTKELLQALKLKQNYQFDTAKMVGSWAGAMGNTQFMPSTYNQYAIDIDGDGKADLWNSTADALGSAANFLNKLGWNRNESWGREVIIPKNYRYQPLGRKAAQPLTTWAKLGFKQANGRPLKDSDISAALYFPAGHKGPAFLAYNNFNVIMRWNNSEFYAISIGHLADRIAGGPALTIKPPRNAAINRNQLKRLQSKLNQQGFNVGTPDGILGVKSKRGLQLYQHSVGLIADGFPNKETFSHLGID